MRVNFILIMSLSLLSGPEWHHNLDEGKQLAQRSHRHILLTFSGSDWCGPCIRLHHEIFEAPVFERMADTELVLLQADFPRLKKNKLPPDQQKLNDAMADRYNTQGKFPYTLLLDDNGKVLRVWDGFPATTADQFTEDVRNGIFADREAGQ